MSYGPQSDRGWRPTLREWRADVLPIGIGILLSALYFRIDAFLIEYWQGAAAVGLYGAVFRIVDALRLFPAAVLAVKLPAMCRAMDTRLLRALAAQLSLAALGASLVLWVLAPALIPATFGPAFAAAVPAFRILLLALPLMALNYALTQQLIAWNGHRAFAVCCATALAVNLGLNAVFIPTLAIAGAAWATVATEVALTMGCAVALAARRASVPVPGVEAVWQEG
jgi:O-antigen/teichoic acid export membrane protein